MGDGVLCLWYGEANDPVLTIEPVPRTELDDA